MSAILTRPLSRTINASLRRTIGRNSASDAPPAAGAFDPSNINYGALTYQRRFWWHNEYAAGLSVNANGTGGMPAVSDPFGAILNCDPDNASTPLPLARLPQNSGAGTRRADGAEFGVGAFYYDASANWPNMNTSGITVAFSGLLPVAGIGGWVFGRDNPAAGVTGSGNQVGFQSNLLASGIDWTTEHRVVVTATLVGNVRALLDGVEVYNATDAGISSWERTMIYMYSIGFKFSGLFAIDSRVSNAEMTNLDNFLQYGPV